MPIFSLTPMPCEELFCLCFKCTAVLAHARVDASVFVSPAIHPFLRPAAVRRATGHLIPPHVVFVGIRETRLRELRASAKAYKGWR